MGIPQPNPGRKGFKIEAIPFAQQCLAPQTKGNTSIYPHTYLKVHDKYNPLDIYCQPISIVHITPFLQTNPHSVILAA